MATNHFCARSLRQRHREPPSVASKTMGTLSLEQSRLRIHICIYLILCESYGLATPKPSGRLSTENYADVAASSSGLRRASFQWYHETPPPQLHYRALITPDSHSIAVSEPGSLTITLISHRQPCGCRVRMIHATSPRPSVPSNQKNDDPS